MISGSRSILCCGRKRTLIVTRISQVWFAGAHSNVGGGYPKQGMSLVALDWLLTEAERAGGHGLRFNASERQSFREHASVDDKLYDSRSGLGLFYRWKIRDIASICRKNDVVPKLHVSVLERIAHGTDDYSPGNLPRDAEVIATKPAKSEHVLLANYRAVAVQKVLETIPGETLLDKARLTMRVGQLSYYLYLVSCVAVLVAALRVRSEDILHPVAAGISSARLLLMLLGAFTLVYVMSLIVDRRLAATFSGFWYPKQTELRDNLKRARVLAKQEQSGERPAVTAKAASF